ncbi:hypothetical protein B6I21_06410, partial [candidate division KSB1 bacterium 4572_119]
VHLITSAHLEQQYTLTVNSVKDRANNPNTILPNSTFNYQYNDITPPEIVNVQALFEYKVDVTFSEPVEKESAESVVNYHIDNDIEIDSVRFDLIENIVHLFTSKHVPGFYTLTVNGIKDQAIIPNQIVDSTKFIYEYKDITPPAVLDVQALIDCQVDIVFSEPLDEISATDTANYQINNGVKIDSISIDANLFTVHLFTKKHDPGNYIIMFNNIKDRAAEPNVIKPFSYFSYQYIDITSPAVDSVHAVNDTIINIMFSEIVDRHSAEEISNYEISKSITVKNAFLNSDERLVSLTTSAHHAGTYQIYISNVFDQADIPNKIPDSTFAEYNYVDTKKPEITSIEVINEFLLAITFSEMIDKESAENSANYQINHDVSVDSCYLDSTGTIVQLFTSEHAEGDYILTVNNIKDMAENSNTILPNTSFNYTYIDLVPPQITGLEAVDETHLILHFSEPIEETSAKTIDNYEIYRGNTFALAGRNKDNEETYIKQKQTDARDTQQSQAENLQGSSAGLAITALTLATDCKTVYMQTSPHEEDFYTLIVNNINDRANNPNAINENTKKVYEYVDKIPPSIVNVSAVNDSTVKIKFTERIDEQSAENVNNYHINDSITIKIAELGISQKDVTLYTTRHQSEQNYTLTLNGIKDLANNPNFILPQTSMDYSYIYIDILAPNAERLSVENAYKVKIYFNEPLTKSIAEKTDNYHINNGIRIDRAMLDSSLQMVTLNTTKHVDKNEYLLCVSNIADCVDPPNIMGDKEFTYQFEQDSIPLLAEISQPSYVQAYLDVGGHCYIDCQTKISSLPSTLSGCAWIRTAIADSSNDEDNFLSFELNDSSFVYIGYDNRAASVPNWLKNNFTKTNNFIELSNNYKLDLWVNEVGPGTVILGGNNAIGAANNNCMYAVIILSSDYRRPVKPDNLFDPNPKAPTEYLLNQNYPNPFNAGTTIKFQLPERSHVLLTIYNIRGQTVINLIDESFDPGYEEVLWNGYDQYGNRAMTGMYFIRLVASIQNEVAGKSKKEVKYNKVIRMIMLK